MPDQLFATIASSGVSCPSVTGGNHDRNRAFNASHPPSQQHWVGKGTLASTGGGSINGWGMSGLVAHLETCDGTVQGVGFHGRNLVYMTTALHRYLQVGRNTLNRRNQVWMEYWASEFASYGLGALE